MSKIPTAEEFFKEKYGIADRISTSNAILLSIEFAKLHIQAALEAASESYLINEQNISDSPAYLNGCILSAYPLENIK